MHTDVMEAAARASRSQRSLFMRRTHMRHAPASSLALLLMSIQHLTPSRQSALATWPCRLSLLARDPVGLCNGVQLGPRRYPSEAPIAPHWPTGVSIARLRC